MNTIKETLQEIYEDVPELGQIDRHIWIRQGIKLEPVPDIDQEPELEPEEE